MLRNKSARWQIVLGIEHMNHRPARKHRQATPCMALKIGQKPAANVAGVLREQKDKVGL